MLGTYLDALHLGISTTNHLPFGGQLVTVVYYLVPIYFGEAADVLVGISLYILHASICLTRND